MEVTARVASLLPLETGVSKSTGQQWQKATIIVEWQDGQFVKKLALSNMKKASEFINLLIGQEYTFKIDVTSREYNGKWYHDVNCYAWTPTAQAAAPVAPAPAVPAQPYQQPYAYPTQPGQAAQPAYPPQPGAPASQPYQPAPAPAPAYNPAQPTYQQPVAVPPPPVEVPF